MQSVQILTLVLLALGACAAQNPVEKVGYCPHFRLFLSDSAFCRRMCKDDASCPQNLKCCRLGCSWQCMNTTQEKNGMCPLATSSSSEEELWRNPLCDRTCKTDQDCAGEAKCCASLCGRTCTKPIKVRPECPVMPKICPRNMIWRDACLRDDHCTRNQKCCFSACGRRCMDSLPEEQEAVTRPFRQEESNVLAL